MVNYVKYICLTLLLLISACTTTSFKVFLDDPDAVDYKKFLVFVPTQNFQVEKIAENNLVLDLKESGVKAVAKYNLSSPLVNLGKEAFDKLISENNIDAIIILSPQSQTLNTPKALHALPDSAYNFYNRESIYLYKADDSWTLRNRTLYLQVIDVKLQKIVWYAEIVSKTWTVDDVDMYMNAINSATKYIASRMVTKMKLDELIPEVGINSSLGK